MATANINITAAELHNTAVKYGEMLLTTVYKKAQEYLTHFLPIPGVQGSVILPSMDVNFEFGPYDANYKDTDPVEIGERVLEVFLGSAQKDLDFNKIALEVYGDMKIQGEEMKNTEIAKKVLFVMAARLGKALGLSIFNAERNPSGHKTKDLYNGYDSIAAAEVLKGTIAEGTNMHQFKEAITNVNAVKLLKEFYRSAPWELREMELEMFLDPEILEAYKEDFQTTHAGLIYNDKYDQTVLEGSAGKCKLVGLPSKSGSKFIQLAPRGVMVYGYGDKLPGEKIEVEKFSTFLTTFGAACRFGAEYRTLDKKWIRFGKLYEAA